MTDVADLYARYTALRLPASPGNNVSALESALGVELPDDIRGVTRFYRGGMLGGISHFTWAVAGKYSVVEKTRAARVALGLPATFVFLAEPAESAILWRALAGPAVVWCHAHDFARCARGEPALSDVTEYETYGDFFTSSLLREAAERDTAG
jgi:hypothetical protein